MPSPDLVVRTDPAADSTASAVVLGVAASPDGPRLLAVPGFEELGDALVGIGVTGRREEIVRLPAPGTSAAGSVVLVGLGPVGADAPGPAVLRAAAGAVARGVRGVDSLAFALPVADDAAVLAVLEGASLGAYAWAGRPVAPERRPAASVAVHAGAAHDPAVTGRASAIAEAVATVKDLVNAPPLELSPAVFADRATALAADAGLDVRVLDEAELAAGGYGGIVGVGQGSTRPPRLVRVEWSPAGASRRIALVGKGITFDSGGLSLKPAASMVGMKYDMTGAASVLAVAVTAARLGVPVGVTAWLCLAENMPGGGAIRPNDVLTLRDGTTVEVLNTDAEGRLVLGDGIAAAREEAPDAIVDIATLTGAAITALGTRTTGAMGDDELLRAVERAAESVDEPVWAMPLPGELRALLDSDVADIANAKPGNTAAGMLVAGVFLEHFAKGRAAGDDAPHIPWLHLDIAGSAENKAAGWGFTGKGPTGAMVRSLLALVEGFREGEAQ